MQNLANSIFILYSVKFCLRNLIFLLNETQRGINKNRIWLTILFKYDIEY